MIASLAIILALFQAVASCPFADKAHGSLRAAPNDEVHRKLKSAAFITDRELFPTCSLGATVTSEANIRAVYTELRKELYALLKRSHQFARSNIFGAALRLAFHDAGEIDLNSTDKLGPDGCLSNTVANSGLLEANTVLMTVFEPMWQKYCDRISRADFWALLGKMAAEAADPTHTLNVPFQYGRKDNAQCDGGADRLPMHQPGIPEFERVFIRQMGLTMHDAVALLGAHTVGHVHPQFSGFGAPDDPEWLKMRFSDNAWDETPESFDHQYYRSMLLETWRNDVNNDRPTLNTWFVAKATDTREVEPEEGPTTFVYNTLAAGNAPIEGAIAVAATADAANTAVTNPGAAEPGAAEGAGGIGLDRRRMQELGSMRNFLHINTIMLNADMALAFPIHTDQNPDNQAFTGVDEETCGVVLGPNGKAGCQSSKYGVVSGEVPTFAQVKAYSENNALFLEDFAAAYAKMTTVGYSLDGAAPAGKLGSLTSVDLGNYWAEPVPFAHAPTPFSASNPYSPSQSFLKSPYGEYEDICPEYDGATYYVDGWPGTPYKITPFVNAFANPIPAVPTHTECREDGHCMSSFEMDVFEVKARPWDRAVPMCKNFPATTFMSYNGSLPGPTITMPSGHESIVRFNNKIRVTEEYDRKFKPCKGNRTGRPYSVHFHGSASLAPFDGWADDETCFGESKDYVYPNNRPNTGWYHDHGAHITADNAYDGMAGFYIISSKQKHGGIGEPYGLEDMEEKLMVLGDKLLDDTCQLRMQPKSVHERSFYGDINTVNGIPYPVMTIEPKWIRFRLLSAAVARPFKVRIKTAEDNKDVSKDICYVIASDGGYRHEPAPFPRAGLFMGVGERYEVVCDFSQLGGKTLIMWNEKDFSQMKDVPYYCYSHLVMKINVLPALLTAQTPAVFDAAALPADSIVPIKQVLTEQDYQKALAMAESGDYHRRMDFGRRWGMWVINGETWTSFKIAADDIGQNTWEVWLLRTGGGWFHPIHLHLVDFYVLRRDGGNGVEEYEKKVAKDVVELGPSNNVYVLARFGAHRGDYMFHCHNLIHEDADMLRAFHMVSSEHGKTASTAEKYVQNPLNGIIYSNYKYADPMFGETEAKPIGTRPPITVDYVRHTLELNLYRIFYPLPADKELYANLSNPWETQWRSLLPEPWGQCGGKGWTGPTSCHAGYDCSYVSEWYSQCVPGTPPPGQQAAWGQCGGNGYTGPTVCVYGFSCVAQSEWYSQCVPSSAKTTAAPTAAPTAVPTVHPTFAPTVKPTAKVSAKPTHKATAKPTTKATAAPSTAPATAQAAWGQCGGQGWTGPTTCVAGYQCVYDSQWYSQCKPVAAGANEQAAWGQCGGEGWTGLTQCSAGYTCVYQSQWYSQCKPVARHMRGRA